jgi:1,4-dihydroxy-2-naphthoate octaprenyltransferase
MVGGSYYALSGGYNWQVLLVSLIPFFLVNNLLLLNQFPDLHADRDAGRKHILTRYGYRFSSRVYLLFLLLAALVLIASVAFDVVSAYSLLGLIVIAMGVPVYRAAARERSNFSSLVPYMGANVGIVLALPAIVGTTLFCC